MLTFDVTIPATVPQRSEIAERLMIYPVFIVRGGESPYVWILGAKEVGE
jgi:hypothetical protein